MNLLQRYRDWRHEREISRLFAECREAYAAGDKAKARHFFHEAGRAIARRSSGSVRRIEEQKGLRFRRSIKQRLMHAFLRGVIPAGFVTTAFRLLNLRSL